MSRTLWRVAIAVTDAAALTAAMRAVETACAAVTVFEVSDGGAWQVEGLAESPPERARLEIALALAWTGRDDAPPAIAVERVAPQDWLARNQASFPPIRAGRFFIHGSHYCGVVPPGRIGLLIDAATAFGTGEHASTRGCLLALDAIARAARPRRVLDMGTGTGVLAIAAAKLWHRRVAARDIDPGSAQVAAHNAARNGVARLVEAKRSDGYRDRRLRSGSGFDLVLANILARPLAAMAAELGRHLAPGGLAVLSGLLARQEPYVLAAQRQVRLHLVRRIAIDRWHTLVLARERATRFAQPSRIAEGR